MSLLRFISTLIFICTLSFSAHALVDMRNANYSDSWIDLQVKSTGYDLRVQRTYNSRTLFSGIFGFGWCTEFETTLKITSENTLRISECGAGFEIEYMPSNYSSKDLEKNIKFIMTEVRKRNRGKPESYFSGIERDIRLDSALRDEFAKQLQVTGKVNENLKYLAGGRATDFIVFKNNEYIRNLSNGTIQKFDKAGFLVQMNDKNGNFIKLAHKGEVLTSATDNQGNSLQFKYYPNSKFVKEIVGPNSLKASYVYSGENLVEVKNAWNNSYKHEYDDVYNLTKIIYPDKTFIALTYDPVRDWVTSFQDRKNCKESYLYKENERDALNNYSSSVKKVCDGKVTNTSSYEFWHKKRKDGTRYLARTKIVNNGRSTDTTYHELHGQPQEINRDGAVSRFDYYSNGLLKNKTEGPIAYSYKYENSCNKVSQVTQKVTYSPPTQQKRKPSKVETKTYVSDFTYDLQKCNLMGAKNSQGQTVLLSYDMRGRITKILDQSRKEVTITYDERFGKPSVVTRPGLGTIQFKYKPDGTMDALDSKDDPLVAIQVANIFSNLLEVIAPATTDANSI